MPHTYMTCTPHATDSEHAKNINSDGFRLYQVRP